MTKISFAHVLALVFGCAAIHAANVEPGQNSLEAKEPLEIKVTKNADGTVIGNPYLSPVSLFLPSKGYEIDNNARGAGRGSPRYFIGRDKEVGLTMSGWFEPSYKFKYRNAKDLWRSERPRKAKNIEYMKINDWDVMFYDLELPTKIKDDTVSMVTLKANLLRASTWIDLHLSGVGIGAERTGMRKKLTDYIKAIRVDVGKAMGFQVEVSNKGASIISPDENPGRLFIKSRSLSVTKADTPSKPGFFTLHDRNDNIRIIAWLRPLSDYHYTSPAMLWDETKASLTKHQVPIVGDFEYEQMQGWDVMLYDVKKDKQGEYDLNMRASRIIDGIWFDVHLTAFDQKAYPLMRTKLSRYMKNIVATGGQAGN